MNDSHSSKNMGLSSLQKIKGPELHRGGSAPRKFKPITTRQRGIVPASIIRRRAKGDGILEEYVYDILKVIEADVKTAMEKGKDESRTEIQTEFNIPPLPRVKAQRRVYYYLMKELTMCDYRPEIDIVGSKSGMQRVYIYVKWMTEDDEDEESYMDQFIKSHSRMNADSDISNNGVGRRRRRPKKRI